MPFLDQTKIIAALLAFIGLVAGVVAWGEHRHGQGVEEATQHYELAIKQIKLEAATELANQAGLTLKAERELSSFKAQQEKKDADNQKINADLHTRLRDAGRLRDPYQETGCGGGGGGASGSAAAYPLNRPADGAEAGGLLSAEFTQFLEQEASDADTINIAYASCKAQLIKDREAP